MLEMLGWAGSLCLAICALPQTIKCYQQKHGNGISTAFLMLWFLGEIFILLYVWPSGDRPLIFNYFGNLIMISIILYYKFFGKNRRG